VPGPLDLEASLYSGQAFRWSPAGDGSHRGFIENRPCSILLDGARLIIRGPAEPGAVSHYFRLDPSHDEFLADVTTDPGLRAAIARFPGLRLLRQDPWEMLVSFIISQNSNEAKIRKTIEGVCKIAGQPILQDGTILHAFPTAPALADLTEKELRSTGMGYRARYVQAAANEVAQGRLDPAALQRMPYDEAFQRLLALDGVGAKVADCILLYGCDHQSAFPSDVWVRRFVRETYLRRRKNPSHDQIRTFALRHFGIHAGYAQHYLFHYRRRVGALASKTS
jgi:N-glycosylase/DNA lyase